MSRILPVILVLLLCMTAAVFASPSGEAGASRPYTLTAPGEFPVVTGTAEIEIMVGRDDEYTDDMVDNRFTEWYEEKTGVHIDWIQVSGEEGEEKANIVLASGQYPEAFMATGIAKTQLAVYGAQGVFVALNDAIERQSVYLKEAAQRAPYLLGDLTAPDGNIYAFPTSQECYHCTANPKFYIYRPWLEQLGMEVPETTEDLYRVLLAFKTQDPNGNGRADEIAYASRAHEFYALFMNAFIYTDRSHLMIDDGVIDTPVNKPGWREGLRYMNRLYAEGLIAPETFTIRSSRDLRAIGENPDHVILGSTATSWYGNAVQNRGESRRWVDYMAAPPVAGPDGLRVVATIPWRANPTLAVTDQAQDVDLITRWVDWLYTIEGTLSADVGPEGMAWRKPNPGEMGIPGGPATWVALVAYGVNNLGWGNSAPRYFSVEVRENRAIDAENVEETASYLNYHAVSEVYEQFKHDEVLPSLFYSEQQARELAQVEAVLKDFIVQSMIQFITGDRSLDSDWESYLEELDRIGIDQFVSINQAAYDAVYR
jgi:putative aldouronate transport system substrate-binding protein